MFDEYQTLERNGVQELVRIKLDEDGTACVYLHDINAIFPQTQLITSCGAPVHYLCEASGKPKRPLRIPYLENRVIEAHGLDVQEIVWTRADLRASISSAPPTSAVLRATEPQGSSRSTNVDALDDFSMLESGEEDFDDSDDGEEDIDDLDDGEREEGEVLDRFEEDDEDRQRQTIAGAVHAHAHALALAQPTQPPKPQSPHVPTRPRPSLSLVEQDLFPESHDLLPDFEESLQHGLVLHGGSVGGSDSGRIRAPELEPPPYEGFSVTPGAVNDQEQAHIVPERVSVIKQACQSILRQQYLPTSCPHPPLFIILPVDPLHWSSTNILHNRISLYFLCDSGLHSTNMSLSSFPTYRHTHEDKRDVHIVEDSGVELRLEEDNVRQFVAKFSHYMLYLLRMLRYGVTLDDVYVAAVYNQPTSLISASLSEADAVTTKAQVISRIRDSIDYAIQFIEACLGDDYDSDNLQSELIRRLSPEDFRVLDQILAASAASKSAKEAVEHQRILSGDKKVTKNVDDKHDGKQDADGSNNTLPLPNKTRRSGLYRTVVSNKYVRWCCATHRSSMAVIDSTFAQRAATISGSFDSCLRSLTFSASSKDLLWIRVMAAKKIKHLTTLDITLDWEIKPNDLSTLGWMIHGDSSVISSLAIRLSGQAPPLTIQSLQSTLAEPWPSKPRDRVIDELLGLFKNTRVKSLELDGEIDLLQVPQIQTKDFSNLDRLSLIRQRTWEGEINDAMAYHKLLGGFLESSCAFLSSVELGFPSIVPGHIRILQVCSYSLTSLRHLDIYRVLRPRVAGSSAPAPAPVDKEQWPSLLGLALHQQKQQQQQQQQQEQQQQQQQSPSQLPPSSSPSTGSASEKKQQQSPTVAEEDEWRKLELSATFRASRVIRLQLLECRTNARNKADFTESLRELLHDDGAHLEELDLRYVGFNDGHAAALEEATRPKSQRVVGGEEGEEKEGVGEGGAAERSKVNCRLRKLVLHGQGLTRKGARALAEVLHRATEPRPHTTNDTAGSDDERGVSAPAVPVPPTHAAPISDPSPFSTFEYPRLGHLELRSIDSIDDAGWAELMSRLRLWSLITLDLHGFWFGSRALYSLASGCEESSFPLPLRVLRLNCSTLDRFGVQQFQAWMPRLKELTTLGLYGFRNVDSGLWMELLPTIHYRWLEHLELICTGLDDGCADQIGILLCEREPHLRLNERIDQPPAYSPACSPTTSSSSPLSSPALRTSPQSGTKPKRQPSLPLFSRSSRDALAAAITASASNSASTASATTAATAASSPPPLPSSLLPVAESSRGNVSNPPTPPNVASPTTKKSRMPLLEIDLRYTDVSRLCLLRLKDKTKHAAQNVRVLLRDQEDERHEEATSGQSTMRGAPPPGPYATSTAGPPLPAGSSMTTMMMANPSSNGGGGRFLRTNSISSLASSASTSSSSSSPAVTALSRIQGGSSSNNNNNSSTSTSSNGNEPQPSRRTPRFGFLRKNDSNLN
ncbi:hypothetical protein DFQ26_005591 [Actinomortierella ambigua]|nr:hypothetical protein DFQ26_005591 [Actinomortierella ambigua]